ncbi:unnamed protein product [Polarella glacialis]|uniref:Calmodulin n=2 Tax=Polarella glacialis TaxID=89957 RepID=A0A813ISS8_POLGL|nr:unnamed protein product [Polarella glacialis]
MEILGCKATSEEVEDVWTDGDKNGSGLIDFAAFASFWAVVTKTRKRTNYREFLTREDVLEMRRSFAEASTRPGGDNITRGELDLLFRKMGFPLKKHQLTALMRDFDSDGSGDIDFEEFCVMMLRLKGGRRLRKISPATHFCEDLWKNENFTVKELQKSGFGLTHFKQVGIPVGQIIQDIPVTALEMRRSEYTASELRRGGMGAAELRSCGFSLAELRVAGFSDSVLRQTNGTLRKCLGSGDLSVLPQQKPVLVPGIGTKSSAIQWLASPAKWTSVPRPVTPRIREHTDWRPLLSKPSRPQTAAETSMAVDLGDCEPRPATAGNIFKPNL